jgi:hypothetical protein
MYLLTYNSIILTLKNKSGIVPRPQSLNYLRRPAATRDYYCRHTYSHNPALFPNTKALLPNWVVVRLGIIGCKNRGLRI